MKVTVKRRNFIFLALAAAGLAAFALAGRGRATSAEYALDRDPEVIAATFASAWCTACKILEPKLAKAIPSFADKPVKFVEYDFTFGETEEVRDAALADGFGPVFDRYAKATGFTVLYDPQTEEVIDVLTAGHSTGAMRAAIARALTIAENRD